MNAFEHVIADQKVKSGKISRSNVLRYSVIMQTLYGRIDGAAIGPLSVHSGGGQVGFEKSVSWSKIDPRNKASEKMRGGALPPGWWIALPELLQKGQGHPSLHWGKAPTDMSIRIVPYQLDRGFSEVQRDSFYIHGTGGKGSDGCLILGPAERSKLVNAIHNAGGVWLHSYLDEQEMLKQKSFSAIA